MVLGWFLVGPLLGKSIGVIMYQLLTVKREEISTIQHPFYLQDACGLSYYPMAHATYQDRNVTFYWATPAPVCLLLWNSTSSNTSFHFYYHSTLKFSYAQLLFSAEGHKRLNAPKGTTYHLITQMPLMWQWYDNEYTVGYELKQALV